MKPANQRKMTEKGQALIVIVLALVGLLGITGLVIDGGNAFLDRRKAQNAADSAALATALARIRGGQNSKTVGLEAAATNGYSNDGVTNTVIRYFMQHSPWIDMLSSLLHAQQNQNPKQEIVEEPRKEQPITN